MKIKRCYGVRITDASDASEPSNVAYSGIATNQAQIGTWISK